MEGQVADAVEQWLDARRVKNRIHKIVLNVHPKN